MSPILLSQQHVLYKRTDGGGEEGYIRSLGLTPSVQFSRSVCDSMNRSTPGLPIHHQLPEFTPTPRRMSIESVTPSNHLILCHPLLLLPSIFPSIRFFPSESALRIRWPKYWSFSFNISPISEHPGLKHTTVYKRVKPQGPTYSTENHTQYLLVMEPVS